MKSMKQLQEEIYEHAVDKGFYDPPQTYGERIALMHSELSEALEEGRSHPEALDHVWYSQNASESGMEKPEGFSVELADCVIRILDYCEHIGVDLQPIIEKKMAYNSSRAHKHGGKHI